VKIAANVAAMTDASLALFRAGHLPVMGEWFALPLIEHAGGRQIGDAVLRIGGASAGADEMVALGREHGKAIYYSIADIPAP